MYSGLNVIFKSWIVNTFFQQLKIYEHDGGGASNRIGRFILFIWFTFCFIFLKEKINETPSWKLLLLYYPQINFARPKVLDTLRFIIQSFWLLMVKQDHTNRNDVAEKKLLFKIEEQRCECFSYAF